MLFSVYVHLSPQEKGPQPNIQPSYIVWVEGQRQTYREHEFSEEGSGDAVFSTEHLYFPPSFLLISLSIKSLLNANAINLDL